MIDEKDGHPIYMSDNNITNVIRPLDNVGTTVITVSYSDDITKVETQVEITITE